MNCSFNNQNINKSSVIYYLYPHSIFSRAPPAPVGRTDLEKYCTEENSSIQKKDTLQESQPAWTLNTFTLDTWFSEYFLRLCAYHVPTSVQGWKGCRQVTNVTLFHTLTQPQKKSFSWQILWMWICGFPLMGEAFASRNPEFVKKYKLLSPVCSSTFHHLIPFVPFYLSL